MSLGTIEQRTEGIKKQAQQLIEQAYYRGFKAGREDMQDWEKDQADRLIEQGRNEAWEAMKKIYLHVEDGGLSGDEIRKIFDTYLCINEVIMNFSASEVVEKLRAYEEQKKEEDSEIHVWDEVQSLGGLIGIVTHISETEGFSILWEDGSVGKRKNTSDFKKTGHHFPQISEVLKKLQEGEKE